MSFEDLFGNSQEEVEDTEDITEETEETKEQKPKERFKSTTANVFQATIHYDNGDTRTLKCYGERERTDGAIVFAVDPTPVERPDEWGYKGMLQFDGEMVHVAYMSREPKMKKVAEEVWEFEWREVNGNALNHSVEVESRREICKM